MMSHCIRYKTCTLSGVFTGRFPWLAVLPRVILTAMMFKTNRSLCCLCSCVVCCDSFALAHHTDALSRLTDADGEWQSMPLPPRQPEVPSPVPTRKQNVEPKASSASKARSTPQEPYDEEAADEPMAALCGDVCHVMVLGPQWYRRGANTNAG